MWPVPSSSTPSVAVPSNSFVFIDTNSFSKDGRKITVGDCALFEALHSSLRFVGIIRKLILGKENSPSLSVNWLYRPADIKLKEGGLLQAAPNEIFYSFHKDEIPAASLLHPCKVTFLRKGVELPSGISSFVCRRVYDIDNECLWWLTDKDYLNSYLTQERQEEVNQLLDKTRVDMYGALQTGGRSPKPLNGAAQLKSSSTNVQNSSSSISSHAKSKKREHGVHNSESVKRERLSKVDDADSGQPRPEHVINAEIAKITDKGGLMDFVGVEKLIQLMRPESAEKKLDLSSRTMLVDVISVTDRFDCLGRFVQLRGLSVLDEWLQEIHKGKIGDGSQKVKDKSVEEFLFCLLRALDRLPVNLHALQTCNVGKSVNHLRSHKNPEIQNKAKSLVNTWKRRVEAEMNIIETKSSTSRGGSWPNTGSRRIGSSSDVGPKSSNSQPSAVKSQQPKHGSSEAVAKSPTSTSPGSIKLSDMPSSANKDGRSCSSSQSPNNSQSCSSDHGKTGASSVSKISSSVSHSKNSSNGFQKEVGKIGSLNRNFSSEKGSPTRHTSERVSDVSLVDNGNSPRLIVRLPARTVSVESPQYLVTTSGKDSVPEASEKQEHKVTEKIDSLEEKNTGNDEPVYSSINTLVESCAKFSEASVSPSVGDDVGMNLLASVAAGEMSPGNNSPLPEDSCSVNVAKLKQIVQEEDNISKPPQPPVGAHISGDSKDASFGCEVKTVEDSKDSAPEIKPDEYVKDDVKSVKSTDVVKPVKVETQVNEESASWSSSDMHEDEKKSVNKRSNSNNLATTSCGDVDLKPKSEEPDDKDARENMDSGPSVSHHCNEQVQKNTEKDEKAPAVAIQEVRPCEEHADVAETSVKLDFDLNEVLPGDDGIQAEVERSCVHTPNPSPVNGNRPALITVASAAKGPFYPSENLLKGKAELGWKGSAATSAFRPAEPRKLDVSIPDNRKDRPLFDFDLNVGAPDDVGQPSVLDLDLNACEETPEVVQLSVNGSRPVGPSSSRGFDLNGPGVEEAGGESIPFSKNGMSGVRMNNMEMGNFSTWFPPDTTYQPITILQNYPSQRMLNPVTASTPLNPEMFRGPVLSSSPAVAFQPSVPFQYSAFPFETNFSLPSVSNTYVDSSSSGGPICFPSQAQLVGPNGVVSMPYRPFFMGNVGPDGRKWSSQGLDLNAGLKGGSDEQLKMFQQMTAGQTKRKEPDGGGVSYKHPQWQ